MEADYTSPSTSDIEVAGNQVGFPLLSLSMCFLLKIKRDTSQITNPKDPNLRKSLSSLSAGHLSLHHDDGSARQKDSLPTLTTDKLSSHVGLSPDLGDVPACPRLVPKHLNAAAGKTPPCVWCLPCRDSGRLGLRPTAPLPSASPSLGDSPTFSSFPEGHTCPLSTPPADVPA